MKARDYRALQEAEDGNFADLSFAGDARTEPTEVWDDALKVLSGAGTGTEPRQDALRVLAAGMFVGTEFAPLRPHFQNVLRTISEDEKEDPDLRRSALGMLVNMKDDTARKVLTKCLEEQATAPVPPAVALEMLSLDDHAAATGFAQEALAKSNEEAVRQQAVRILGADPAEAERLRGILRDKDEFREVRRSSAVALRALEPKTFESEAAAILSDPHDYPDIKATVGKVLERTTGLVQPEK